MADQVDGMLSPFLRKKRFDAVKPFVRGRVLDFGCGIGRARHMLNLMDYVGVDADAESLRIAKAENPSARFLTPEELLSRPDEKFDTILVIAVVEHLPDPAAVLRALKAHLNPGGRLVLTTPQPKLDWVHGLGSRIGIFSHEAHEEHQSLMDQSGIQDTASRAGFRLAVYSKFLFGANQLAVLE